MAKVAIQRPEMAGPAFEIGKLGGAEGIRAPDPLDANSRQRGRLRSLGQVNGPLEVPRSCWRSMPLLYSAAVRPQVRPMTWRGLSCRLSGVA